MFLILGILFLFFLLFINYNNFNIVFYTKENLAYFLSKDNDNFYKNLHNDDLKLRNIYNIYDFLIKIEDNLYSFNNNDKKKIKKAIYKANKKLKNINYPGFNYNKIKNIPWHIGGIDNNNYEFGLPHTRNHLILINKKNIYDNNLYKLLIHEKIHVYQKKYPEEINKFLNYFNFKKYRYKTNYDRGNPDLDNYIYKKNNIIFQCIIKDSKIICTNDSYKYEHPFEYMAYDIVDKID